MHALSNKTLLYIIARDSRDIENVKKVSKYMQENFGYKLVDGNDEEDEYYDGLHHHYTVREARTHYNIAKNKN